MTIGTAFEADHDLRLDGTFRAARLIAPETDSGQGGPAPFVATTFIVPEGASPVLRISALGLYRAFVNGRRVGEALLTPGWTCYDDRTAFQDYDLAGLVTPGENRIEIWLGDGWYRSALMWHDTNRGNLWGEHLAAIAEIFDGDDLLAATGPDWTSGLTPITANGIYYGEDHDSRVPSEATGGVSLLPVATRFVPHEIAPVVELPELAPIDSWQDDEGRTIYDFGQNVGGFVRLQLDGPAGASVRVEHAEVLGPDRAFDNRNYRTARAELTHVLAGNGPETCAPVFSFMGFRYARVTTSQRATVERIASVPITSVPEITGGIKTGVPEVDRLVQNTIWSQRANFIEVPTDCPQRDERLGWTGDAQVFAGTACWLADSESFLRKYLRDVMHDQRDSGAISHFSPDTTVRLADPDMDLWAGSTGWGDVIVVVPWQLYLHYGDDTVLRECFPAMLKWLDYLWSISDGPIIRPHSTLGKDGFTFGDWLQPVGDNRKPRPTIGDDCAATLYFALSTELTARIARVIGEEGEATRLDARLATIREAFADEYISASGRLAHNDQTSYALAFLCDLIPERHLAAAKSYFRRVIEDADYLIGTGFIGTYALLPALTRTGMNDLAEKVFLNRSVPGWLYQVEQGATSIWERWDSIGEDGTIYEPSMNSYNHYAYGAVCQWLFEDVAGVTPTAAGPGFDLVTVRPQVLPGLGRLSMWHDCRHGRIEAAWDISDGRATYRLTLPEGCEGRLPASAFSDLNMDGTPIEFDAGDIGLASGSHVISFAVT